MRVRVRLIIRARAQCKVTGAHGLPCRLVLHTVGPNRDLHSEAEGYPLLHAAYRSCLARVVEHDVRSVALSCVSTGAYRFPSRPAAHVALSTVRKVNSPLYDPPPQCLPRLSCVPRVSCRV
jgi:O-acetyl-ADP-ribose deacetylase (regulator of RNase III)